MRTFLKTVTLFCAAAWCAGAPASAQKMMEKLGRGIVAVNQGGGKVYVGWRLLGTDPTNMAFNLYRRSGSKTAIKLNSAPITVTTNFIDQLTDTTQATAYFVKEVLDGKEGKTSQPYLLAAGTAKPYLSVPLQTPNGYRPNDGSVGDLDGDGEYEIVVHQVGRGNDNSHAGITTNPVLEAYKLNGTLLWRINLGRNIREGAHYTQFMVYDLDGDGKAEVACKTADGTIDGKGNVIGDSTKTWRNAQGHILHGPEYLTVFNGQTGAAINTTNYVPTIHPETLEPTTEQIKAVWGDGYGNRGMRFLAAVAYLDGKHPSLIMCRGYYTRTVIAAWDLIKGKLQQRWVFDSDATPENRAYRGQGNHNLSIADVDGDGKDEIVYGAMTLDDNGKGLYSVGTGHADALHVSDLDPDRPGLEVFDIQERFGDAGANFRDARTGEIIWKKPSVKAGDDGEGPGRGLSLDVDPRYRGFESWVAGAGISGMFDVKGNKIAERNPSVNFGIFWDDDMLSELLDGTRITKWDYQNSKADMLLNAADYNCVSNNGTKSNPVLSGDILGDWREEAIYATRDAKELRIFTTTIPAKNRFYTFMHDPQYRVSIAWQNVAYNQPPHTSFFVGHNMKAPPKPNIVIVGEKK